MGSLVLYILEWAFTLIVLLTIYKAVLSGTTFYRFNRIYLLAATMLSALIPLIHVNIPERTQLAATISIEETEFARELSSVLIMPDKYDEENISGTVLQGTRSDWWAIVLVGIYSAYVLMLIVGWARGIFRARRFLKDKPRRRISRSVWLVTHDEGFGPFSWMNYIVISDAEDGFARRASLRHEYSHIRLLHSVDLIFLLSCTIVNPVCWLVLQELKIVHEYEADNEVISRYGISNKDYQRLLIMRTVGAEAYALASSFNLNIKKRIIMMNRNKTSKRRLTWLLLLIPLLGLTSVMFARTEKTIGPDKLSALPLSDDNSSFNMSGKVVDHDGNPIESASLSVLSELMGMTEPVIIFTDINGAFSLNVRKGEYIAVSKTGYNQIIVRADQPDANLTISLKKTGETGQTGSPTNDDVMEVVEELPEFPGGTAAMLGYLAQNIRYPAESREKNIQGRVIISFTIDKEGYIKDAEVVKSVDPTLDAEALRVISAMPQWIPGKQKGEPVNVRFAVPINFRLDSGDSQAARRETNSGPRWIVVYDVKSAEDENKAYSEMFARGFMSMMSSYNVDGQNSGILSSPGIAEIVSNLKAAQAELETLQKEITEEIAPMSKELEKMTDEYARQRETLTEEIRTSREQELQEKNQKFQEKYRDSQKKIQDRSDEIIGDLEPKMKNALHKMEKNKYYICGRMPIEPNIEDIATAENLESAVNALFEGRRNIIALPYSESNLQLLKSTIRKHEGKSVYYMN